MVSLSSTAAMESLLARASKSAIRPAYKCTLQTQSSSMHISYLLIQSTVNRAVSTTFLVQETDEVGLGPTAFVSDAFLVVLGEEFDSGEPTNAVFLRELRVLLVIGVNIGDNALSTG